MDHLWEFFLENQRDLDGENALTPPPPESQHQWERVLIYGRILNHGIPGYGCGRCRAEKYAYRFDDQNFEGRTYNYNSRRKAESPPGPPCPVKTVRDHQCTYPSVSGSDKCNRHSKLFPKACCRCGVAIACSKALHRIQEEMVEIFCFPKCMESAKDLRESKVFASR